MSKGLEALKNIHSHWNCCNPNSNGCDDKDFEIIEKELKDYEDITGEDIAVVKAIKRGSLHPLSTKVYERYLNEHRALAIIKTKLLGISYNNMFGEYISIKAEGKLTQEEYDLVKEVLL